MICRTCNKVTLTNFGSGKFCSRSCANSRVRSNELKKRVSTKLIKCAKRGLDSPKAILIQKSCVVCNYKFTVISKHKGRTCCSIECRTIVKQNTGRINGRQNAAAKVKRSKNEIYFAELCMERFKNVVTNQPIFEGWDADVVILDLNIAVLWNGKWHYEKITQQHSLLQVQTRDKLKLDAIQRTGYRAHVVKDLGSSNRKFVEQEFEKFISWIGELAIT